MISLWDAATAAGFKVTPNPALGTIDVNVAPIPKIPMPVDDLAMSAPAETSPSEASGPKPTRVVKSGNIPGQEDSSLKVLKGIPPHKINKPGAAVNVQEHLVPGRYNLVVFGADW